MGLGNCIEEFAVEAWLMRISCLHRYLKEEYMISEKSLLIIFTDFGDGLFSFFSIVVELANLL